MPTHLRKQGKRREGDGKDSRIPDFSKGGGSKTGSVVSIEGSSRNISGMRGRRGKAGFKPRRSTGTGRNPFPPRIKTGGGGDSDEVLDKLESAVSEGVTLFGRRVPEITPAAYSLSYAITMGQFGGREREERSERSQSRA